MHRKFTVFTLAAALLGNALVASAQERERQTVVRPQVEHEFFIAPAPGAPRQEGEVRGDNVIFMATELSFAGKVVKGAPYSAQAVTEFVQTLADGNRIVRKNTAQVYRDSEGRTRRDQTLGHIGPYATSGDTPQAVFINDPVAGVHYILEPGTKTARKLPRVEVRVNGGEGGSTQMRQTAQNGAIRKFEIERTYNVRVPGPGGEVPPPPPPVAEGAQVEFVSQSSKAETKTEKLDARSFDGVQAEGTRTTTTIPAGEFGNEQPIQIVDERWYSPELQVVVMTRHSDPRSGETTYRLTNITRTEPSATLFQVPSDYTVREPQSPGMRRMRRPAPPPPSPEN